MQELSMNILDVAQNSIRAGASQIEISLSIDSTENLLSLIIRDNGCGMSESEIKHASDPFYTTNGLRKTGLGLSFLKMASEQANGSFCIKSNPQIGTTIQASFILTHINLMPLGDIGGTITTLILADPDIDYFFCYTRNTHTFAFDTREIKKILIDLPISHPAVTIFLREYITEQTTAVNTKT